MKPQNVSQAEFAFPARVSHLMPPYEEIPAGFKQWNGGTKWNQLQRDWFFSGLEDLRITWKDGIDGEKALRHLHCIQGSFEPKHEHKEAAVAYLLSLWADDATWKKAQTRRP